MMVSCGPISTLHAMMNDRAANCWSCASVSKPLEEPVLPKMPFAPPEGDYGDDSETTENLEQFGHEQGRDTLVSASGSSGSSYQAGQMFMGTWRPKGGPKAVQRRYTVYYTNLYYLFFFWNFRTPYGAGNLYQQTREKGWERVFTVLNCHFRL